MAATAREQMIAAAEHLAVERGFGAMSLREVQATSGQRNKSAAQYHFGSREGLIEAVVVARMGPVNERRLAALAALDAQPDPPTRRQLVEAFVEPLAAQTLGAAPSHWARFVFQGLADPAVSAVVQRCFEGHSFREVHERLRASLDHLPAPLRTRRVDHAVALVVLSLAGAEGNRAAGRRDALPVAAHVADLVDTALAVLDAPASEVTLAALPATPAHR